MKALGPSAGICRGAACKALFDVFEFVCFCHESCICSCSFFCFSRYLFGGIPFAAGRRRWFLSSLLVSFLFGYLPAARAMAIIAVENIFWPSACACVGPADLLRFFLFMCFFSVFFGSPNVLQYQL